jgi:hypothetical protein
MTYASLKQIGETFIKEDDVKWVPERIFSDDQNLKRIYNLPNSCKHKNSFKNYSFKQNLKLRFAHSDHCRNTNVSAKALKNEMPK